MGLTILAVGNALPDSLTTISLAKIVIIKIFLKIFYFINLMFYFLK